MASNGQPVTNQPRFFFGSMALSEETGRQPALADSNQSTENDGDAPSLNEVIYLLRMASLNEHFSPEILPYQSDTVNDIRTLVDQQTEAVDEEEDENGDAFSFEAQLKRMEIDRINYMLRDYLRVRIKKIESSVHYIFKDTGTATYEMLSKDEQKFAIGYMDITEDHFKKSFLSMLPPRVQILDRDGKVDPTTGPSLNKFVFCRIRNSIGSYAVGEEENDDTLDLDQNDILCIRYKSIRQLLLKEDVELV